MRRKTLAFPVQLRVLPVALGVVPHGTNLGRTCPMVKPPVQKCGSLPQAGALPLSEQSATSETREARWPVSFGDLESAAKTAQVGRESLRDSTPDLCKLGSKNLEHPITPISGSEPLDGRGWVS